MGRGASSFCADLFLRLTTSFPFDSDYNVMKIKLVLALCYLSMTPVVLVMMAMEPEDRGALPAKANSARRLLNYTVHLAGIVKNMVSIICLIKNRNVLRDVRREMNRIRSESFVHELPKRSKFFTAFNVLFAAWFFEQGGSLLTEITGYSHVTFARAMVRSVNFVSTQFFFSLIAQILTFHEALRPLYFSLLKHRRADVTMRLYLDITWMSEQFLQAYSLIIFLNVFWFFLWALSCAFDVYSYFLMGYRPESWSPQVHKTIKVFLMINFIDICVSFVLLLQAITLSKKQEEKFNEALFWKMIRDKTNEFRNNELLKFHFMVRRETEITACGFFKLDNSLLCSMLESAVTYLVIVFQYSTNPETSTEEPATISSVQLCMNITCSKNY